MYYQHQECVNNYKPSIQLVAKAYLIINLLDQTIYHIQKS
ncbi:hypothetical protein pb186bvf_016378 [Paramecium bursaria]